MIHELGHRLLIHVPKTKELDEHRVLFLVLYDIWESLSGRDFADRMVEVEKKRKAIRLRILLEVGIVYEQR